MILVRICVLIDGRACNGPDRWCYMPECANGRRWDRTEASRRGCSPTGSAWRCDRMTWESGGSDAVLPVGLVPSSGLGVNLAGATAQCRRLTHFEQVRGSAADWLVNRR